MSASGVSVICGVMTWRRCSQLCEPDDEWFQWNSRFRDDFRGFVKSDPGLVPALMVRLDGSDDVFPDGRMDAYHPYQSVNYITCHDGLRSTISRRTTRNATGPPATTTLMERSIITVGIADGRATRMCRRRSWCFTNGTPMIRARDEFMRTQGGKSNPYNQDNETSWVDWDQLMANRDTFTFVQRMIAFRKSYPSLCRSRLLRHDVRWYGVSLTVYMLYHSHSLAFYLNGILEGDEDLYVMINVYRESFHLVILEESATQWKRAIDTSLDYPEDLCESGAEVRLPVRTYLVQPRSVVVLVR